MQGIRQKHFVRTISAIVTQVDTINAKYQKKLERKAKEDAFQRAQYEVGPSLYVTSNWCSSKFKFITQFERHGKLNSNAMLKIRRKNKNEKFGTCKILQISGAQIFFLFGTGAVSCVRTTKIFSSRASCKFHVLASKKGLDKAKQMAMRYGLPGDIRRVIWPLAIGNSLQITDDLFSIFKEHARAARHGYEESKSEDPFRECIGKEVF